MQIAVSNTRQNWQIRIAVCILAILLFSLVGPYSTYERFSVPVRFAYWGALIGCFLLPAYWIGRVVRRSVSGSALQRDIVSVLASGTVVAPAIWGVNRVVLGPTLLGFGSLVEHLLLVWLICAIPVLVRHHMRAASGDAARPLDSVEEVSAPDVPLLRHLEPEMRGAIRRVSASDRQSIIHTQKGEASLRMRFADALIQLEGASGMRVHRSHWVAFDAITRLEQDGRRYVATLSCGGTVPVSPAYLGELADAGIALARD
jgi:hypothetical protein